MTPPRDFKTHPGVSSRKGQDTPGAPECEKRTELDTPRFSLSRDKRSPVRRAAALSFPTGGPRGLACYLEVYA